ncbi:phage tail protein [Enterobacter mori]|uniref:phage tail protein n=1 Tax=Enterobacter mori TaxID=539813 RepID=UPI00398BAC67
MGFNPLSVISANVREQAESWLDELPPLMMWGGFIFSLSTLAYQRLTVQEGWSWAAQPRIGETERLQYTGKKAPTIQFECELYASLVNKSLLTSGLETFGLVESSDEDPVEQLRAQANLRTPFMLVTGTGRVMGFWVLTQMSQSMDSFARDGKNTHQTVSLTLQYYGATRAGVADDLSALKTTSRTEKIRAAYDNMKDFLGDYL